MQDIVILTGMLPASWKTQSLKKDDKHEHL